MKKLTLSLALTSLLYLSSPTAMGGVSSGFDALVAGENEKAYQLFVKESKKDSNAAFIVGMLYYYGIGVPQDDQQAETWLLRAAEAGNGEALYNLGYLRAERKLPATSGDASGLELLLEASHAGIDDAVIILAIKLLEEEGMPETFFTEEVTSHLLSQLTQIVNGEGENAGLAGMVLASTLLYPLPFQPSGPDYLRAVSLLEESYEKGFIPAVMGLAALYNEGGYGLEADPIKAAYYEAILLENFMILAQISDLFPKEHSHYRVMTPQQRVQYQRSLEKMAAEGSVSALLQLIYRYEVGEGVEKDPLKVIHYQEMLANLGTGEALYALALMQLESEKILAFQTMQRAAEDDYLPAIHWLSDSFNYGWNDDSSIIATYELQGAHLGDTRSIKAVVDRLYDERSNVGWWNESSRPLAIIEKELYDWLIQWQQVAQNESQPYLELSEAYKQGLGVAKDPEMALKTLQQGIENVESHQQLLLDLADYYRLGFGVERDPSVAMGYYLQSEAIDSTLQGLEGVIALYLESDGFQRALLANHDGNVDGGNVGADLSPIALSPLMLLELFEVELTPELTDKVTYAAKQGGALLVDATISAQLYEHLLDRLEILLGIEGYESRYSYLLADRYMAQYWALLAQIEEEPTLATSLSEALNEALALAKSYYRGASDLSEQAHLHAAEAEIALANAPMLLDSGHIGIDQEIQSAYLRAAGHNLQQIQTLLLTEEELNAAFLDLQNHFDDPSRFLNRDETERAYQSLFQIMEELPSLQSWYGERLLPGNQKAFLALQQYYVAQSAKIPNFAQYYLALEALAQSNANTNANAPEMAERALTAYSTIKELAERDYLPAIYLLADRYQQEDALLIEALGGSQLDLLFWLEKAAQLKEDEAIYRLAEIYYDQDLPLMLAPGEGARLAITYYQQLSDPDYRFAKYHLEEVKARLERYQEIQQGAVKKDPESLFLQSQIYRYGEYGAMIDLQRADQLLIEAAEAGSIGAMRAYYDQYVSEMEMDEATLARFNRYHIAYVHLTHRDWETQRLADRYLKGDRIPESRKKAREYYQFAMANDPDSSAYYDLRQMDLFDKNMPLAEKGNSKAMLTIGRAYSNGAGVKENQELAYHWLKRAAESGDRDAAFYFGVMAQEGIIDEAGEIIIAPDWELALKWYEAASPRFKATIEDRVERYRTLYQPAAAGDSTAILALGELHLNEYRSYGKSYDLKMARSYYEEALALGVLEAHLGLSKLLEGEARHHYLENLLDRSQREAAYPAYQAPDFQLGLIEMLLMQSDQISLARLQFAISQLEKIAIDPQNSSKIRIAAFQQLLTLYQREYVVDEVVISAPDFEKSRALALQYSVEFPILKRVLADTLYQFREEEAQEEALQLWQEAGDEGDYISLIRLYRHLFPRSYDTISLAELNTLEALYQQYLAIAPTYPVGPSAYREFLKNYEIEGVLDNSTRAEMSLMLAALWEENGVDFIRNPQKVKYWYAQSLAFAVDDRIVTRLLEMAENEYQRVEASGGTQENESTRALSIGLLAPLSEIYLYSATLGKLDQDHFNQNNDRFDKLTSLQKHALMQLAQRYQDLRDYSDSWVVMETLQSLDEGDLHAAYRLGGYYLEGRYVRQNIPKALYYYQLAGEAGIADAYNRLGHLYWEEEYGIAQDYAQALAYFEKGAALGDSNTAHLAGDLLYFGREGIQPDYQRAFDYYDQTDLATGSHHALAKYKQAEILYRGLLRDLTIEDFVEAYRLLLLAAEHGDLLAIDALDHWSYEAALAEAAARHAKAAEVELVREPNESTESNEPTESNESNEEWGGY